MLVDQEKRAELGNNMSAAHHWPLTSSHLRKGREVRWELLAALTLNFGIWLLIAKVVARVVNRSPFA